MARRTVDDDELFLQAMRDMGLAGPDHTAPEGSSEELDFGALMRAGQEAPAAPPRVGAERQLDRAALATAASPHADDDFAASDALFVEAMAALNTAGSEPPGAAEREPWPADPRVGSASPGGVRGLARRIKAGTTRARRTLDLHGKTRDQALPLLRAFIETARADNLDVVKVITGRGLHSVGDAVLMGAAVSWLTGPLREHVWQVVKAPADKGGEGARYVFLRAPARRG